MFWDSVPAVDPVPGNRDPSAGKGPAQAAMVHRKKKETAKRLAATLTVSHGNERQANVCHRKNPSGGNFLFLHKMPIRPQQPKTRFIPS